MSDLKKELEEIERRRQTRTERELAELEKPKPKPKPKPMKKKPKEARGTGTPSFDLEGAVASLKKKADAARKAGNEALAKKFEDRIKALKANQ